MRSSWAALAATLLMAASASAQPMRVPPVTNLPRVPLTLPQVTTISRVNTSGAHGSITTAPDVALTPLSALSYFAIGFQNGDHGFRRLQVFPEGALARLAINDQNEDDPFGGDARWVNFTGGIAGSVTGNGGGRATLHLTIPAGPANSTFALQGFEFARAGGTDANVSTMGITLEPSGTSIEVLLSDNEGGDLRLGQPRPRSFDRNVGRPYTVTVRYVWIPNGLIASTGAITGNQVNREAASIPGGNAVLRGFSYAFQNGDHHLMTVLADTANGGSARFQDSNTDDPMRWRLEYAVLR